MTDAYKVFFTQTFERKLSKCDKLLQDWVESILDQLAKNPQVGKPLGAEWFREKKLGKFRIYYLIYEDLKSVYLVNLSTKKDQQSVINSIKLLMDAYKKEIERQLR